MQSDVLPHQEKDKLKPNGGLLFMRNGLATQDAVWLGLMATVLFVLLLPFSSYVGALSLIQPEWNLNNTQSAIIYSAYLGGYAISALLVVPLTDRFKVSHIFITSSGISVLANATFPFLAYGVISASVLRSVAGIGLAGVYMPGLKVISERFGSRARGRAMGLFVSSFYAANSASLVATGLLMSWMDWRGAYFSLSLASGFSVPLAYLILRKFSAKKTNSSGTLDLSVLRDSKTRLYIMGYTLHAFELYAVRVWLPAYFMAVLIARGSEAGHAAVVASTSGGLILAAGAFGPFAGGLISDRWGRARTAAVIFAISGCCCWTIGWLGEFPWAVIIIIAILYSWAISADSSIYSTGVTEVVSFDRLGSAMALQAFLGFLGGIVGPIFIGGVLDLAMPSLKWGVGFSSIGLVAVVAVTGLVHLHHLTTFRD